MRSTALPFLPDRSRALALGIRAALLCLPLSIAPGLAIAQSTTQQAVRSYDKMDIPGRAFAPPAFKPGMRTAGLCSLLRTFLVFRSFL